MIFNKTPQDKISCEVLVIGSGPGGAITACLLAEAGVDVLLVEEGPFLPLSSSKSYSSEEMDQKYRHGGLTVAFGKNKITYAEARCVGGGSEINAGLYHRPLMQRIETWRHQYKVEGLDDAVLKTCLEESERDLCVSYMPDQLTTPSLKLKNGAEKLGWKFTETARCFKYQKKTDGTWLEQRQSMTETFIPRALQASCRIMPDTKVKSLILKGKKAVGAIAIKTANSIKIDFQHVFVCAGAVQTPFLLRKSGIRQNIGNSLRIHPMVRLAAVFPEEINDDTGVPAVQIEEFKPDLTLGCSCSSPGHLALWLDGTLQEKQQRLKNWKHMAIFYAAITADGVGSIRCWPMIPEPFVSYKLTQTDLKRLGEGLFRLGEVLFASGATELLVPVQGYEPIKQLSGLEGLGSRGLPSGGAPITAIHLFSSCPMGEDKSKCAVNSFGKLHNYDNIYLNDASIMPDSAGGNPQATIMAITRRNAKNFLQI